MCERVYSYRPITTCALCIVVTISPISFGLRILSFHLACPILFIIAMLLPVPLPYFNIAPDDCHVVYDCTIFFSRSTFKHFFFRSRTMLSLVLFCSLDIQQLSQSLSPVAVISLQFFFLQTQGSSFCHSLDFIYLITF